MSRAFVTDKEDWIYCAKAGGRCMHAESGRPCRRTDCEYFKREAQTSRTSEAPAKPEKAAKDAKDAKVLRVVARKTEKAGAGAAGRKDAQPRKTRKASLPKPRKWGGRSGSTTH